MSSICTRCLLILALAVLVMGCADLFDSGQSNNTCFSTVNLSDEQHGWFVEAAEDWNWFEDREAITVDDGCNEVGFADTKTQGKYTGKNIIFRLGTYGRCDSSLPDFGSTARHEMGHALGYFHESDIESVMHSPSPKCATLTNNPPQFNNSTIRPS